MSLGGRREEGRENSKGRLQSKEKELCVHRIRRSKEVWLRSRGTRRKTRGGGQGGTGEQKLRHTEQYKSGYLAFILRGEY